MTNNTKSGPPIKRLPGEQWCGVAEHEEAYSISSMGRLWSHIHHRLLRPVRGHVVLAGGPVNVGELVLETHGGEPRPAAGMIAWPVDRDARWPYRADNLRWITRAEMLQILSRARTAKLAAERARSPRPRPQPEVICYRDIPTTPSPRTRLKVPAQRRLKGAQAVIEYYGAGSPAGTSPRA